MGVKDLWSILSPICEKKSLWELQDQTVAIDLSVWICENQRVDSQNINMYLRNLFFRTSCMLLLGIRPIFVLEGEAPKLKYNAMKHRKVIQSKSKPMTAEESEEFSGRRTRLRSLQKQCENLLKCMGISCVYSEGEAEALCAALNSSGIVDGVISKDSDCFLYGARIVYRNFNISSSGGSFEKFDMRCIEEKLNLGRNKLIALSLLCGCDYNEKGVEGIGKETALKYLSTIEDSEALTKLSMWRSNNDESGSSISKIEKNLRQRCLLNPEFPFYDVQNEYLKRTFNVSNVNFKWNRPNLSEFVIFIGKKLAWNTEYATEKFLPLLSRWHLLHSDDNPSLVLERIVKKRKLKCILSYEIKWFDFDSITVEPASILKLKYQTAIDEFENSKLKPKKEKKKAKLKPAIDVLNQDMKTLDVEKRLVSSNNTRVTEDSITVSDFECSASDLLELSFIVESIISR